MTADDRESTGNSVLDAKATPEACAADRAAHTPARQAEAQTIRATTNTANFTHRGER